jgi:ABC-type multidrug transport system fused ATPase/permease subunit
VASSDRVFFVEDGQITGEGSYEELIEGHDAFRAMATGS